MVLLVSTFPARVVGRDELLDTEGPKRTAYTQYKRYVLGRAGVPVDDDDYDHAQCASDGDEAQGMRSSAL